MRLPRHSVLSCCLQAVEYANCGGMKTPGHGGCGRTDSMGFCLDGTPARRLGMVRDGQFHVQGLAEPLPDDTDALRAPDAPGFVYVESGRGSWFWRHWDRNGATPFMGRPRHHFSGRLEARLVVRSGVWTQTAGLSEAANFTSLAVGERCAAMFDGTTPDLGTFRFGTVSGCLLEVPRPFSVWRFRANGTHPAPAMETSGKTPEERSWFTRALWLIRGPEQVRDAGAQPATNPEPGTETAHDCTAVRRPGRLAQNAFPCRLYLTLERTE